MSNTIIIFIWIWLAMIALSFVEAYVEGRYPWQRRKVGWKLRFGKFQKTKYHEIIKGVKIKPAETHIFSGYHFFLMVVMLPLLVTLPLVVYGWNLELFGVLVSAYFSGLIIEDFVYFLVNPAIKFSDWNERFINYDTWLRIGKFQIPTTYLYGLIISLVSWYFLWR